jgi:hypothetical protein
MATVARKKKSLPIIHVRRVAGGWAIWAQAGGTNKEVRTKEKALRQAKSLAKRTGGKVVVDLPQSRNSIAGRFIAPPRSAVGRRRLPLRAATDEIPDEQADLFNAAAIAAARALAR